MLCFFKKESILYTYNDANMLTWNGPLCRARFLSFDVAPTCGFVKEGCIIKYKRRLRDVDPCRGTDGLKVVIK